uniref:Uncharacterized protein n=1 Tax=Glossina pallidipes TaxID=7398 RepID=A0A1A9ZZY7_GLOPL
MHGDALQNCGDNKDDNDDDGYALIPIIHHHRKNIHLVRKMEEKLICDKTWASGSASDMLQQISDESFAALEVMCNKTSSDPSSTLFRYLNSDSKKNLLANVKGRLVNGKAETRLGLGIT